MTNLGEKYSLFPIQSEIGKVTYDFYQTQQKQLWSTVELKFADDAREYQKLPRRLQQLYKEILVFFSPGDGLICENVARFIRDAKDFEHSSFFIIQQYIEVVHAESYGLAITSVLNDDKQIKDVISEVESCDAVKAKAKFLKKYIECDLSLPLRYLAAACTEGIFFVTLFALVFYFRDRNLMPTFVFLNEQVSKDETLHKDYYCKMVSMIGLTEDETKIAYDIVDEALNVELEHLKYLLRDPIDDVETDRLTGVDYESIASYSRGLANDVLTRSGLSTRYEAGAPPPYMKSLSLENKTNFYEGEVGNYRNGGLEGEAINLENPEDSEF